MHNQNYLSPFDIDKNNIWHPYSNITNSFNNLYIKKAKGVYLYTHDKKKLIDAMSSWWCTIFGYQVKELDIAIKKQLKKMAHVMFGGITHPSAIKLADLLLSILPKNLDKIFYADSGSVAVEIALKMALQYQKSKNIKTKKTKFLSLNNAYHGDTFGAMSVCDPINGMHNLFVNNLMENIFAPSPKTKFHEEFKENDDQEIYNLLEKNHEKIAAIIVEPIVQGAGGMRFYHPKFLTRVCKLAKETDTLIIFDEIATGFGRSGKLFAFEHTDIIPDILCLGKALSAGYINFAATITSAKVENEIAKEDVFMHGPTFMASPLACAVCCAALKKLLNFDYLAKVAAIERELKIGLEKCKNLSQVFDVRVLGAIGVVELKDKVDLKDATDFFTKHGVWLRPFNKLIYLMPPFIIKKEEIKKVTDVIYQYLIS